MCPEWQINGNHRGAGQSDSWVCTERVWRKGVPMGSILVRDFSQETIKRLKERARLNGRSLQQAAKALLKRAAKTLTMREARRLSDRWRRRLGARPFSDSAIFIRDDRNSR